MDQEWGDMVPSWKTGYHCQKKSEWKLGGISSAHKILSAKETFKQLAAIKHLAGVWKRANLPLMCASIIRFVALGMCSLLLPTCLLSKDIAYSQLHVCPSKRRQVTCLLFQLPALGLMYITEREILPYDTHPNTQTSLAPSF